jgi:hypothetical protein
MEVWFLQHRYPIHKKKSPFTYINLIILMVCGYVDKPESYWKQSSYENLDCGWTVRQGLGKAYLDTSES